VRDSCWWRAEENMHEVRSSSVFHLRIVGTALRCVILDVDEGFPIDSARRLNVPAGPTAPQIASPQTFDRVIEVPLRGADVVRAEDRGAVLGAHRGRVPRAPVDP